MIRHVLPDRQQFGGNDEAVARAVADHLARANGCDSLAPATPPVVGAARAWSG
jgi:hypothetical protein